MKRALRLLALIVAAVYGTSFLLHVFSYPKEDVPAEIWAGAIFLCSGALYFYLVRRTHPTSK
ncbi:MAG: hypothetical protein ACLPHP_09515 [Candidatus Sulfotelmatobacter sp.]